MLLNGKSVLINLGLVLSTVNSFQHSTEIIEPQFKINDGLNRFGQVLFLQNSGQRAARCNQYMHGMIVVSQQRDAKPVWRVPICKML